MAQEKDPAKNLEATTEDVARTSSGPASASAATQAYDDDDEHLHYYSGGEVKELEGTRVPPALWAIYIVVILAAIISFFTLGALGPKVDPYKPVGGSASAQNALQADLQSRLTIPQIQAANAGVDLSRIPLPQGQNVEQAINAGSDVYQTYCIGCHGPNQDGNGVNAASLNPKPRNLRDAPFMQAMSYERIYTSVHKGVPGTAMLRWENTLTEPQMQDVIAYVWSLTAPKAPPALANTTSGGSHQYTGQSTQISPKPITPVISGNPAAHTTTAPPSSSGQPTGATAAGQASQPEAGTANSGSASVTLGTGSGVPAQNSTNGKTELMPAPANGGKSKTTKPLPPQPTSQTTGPGPQTVQPIRTPNPSATGQ